ncbi:hypothetical protein Tco_1043135 [Tanacetum coccineum]|uniref:Uncharacterized protein n=1 Tax=Tanacetum coccineum TaxID=301880 RepID=A0ABQ5GMG2_9ASTR
MHTTRGDGVACIKRRRRNPSGDGVRNLATASGRGRLKRGSRIIYVATASGLQSDAVHCLGDCKTSCEVFATSTLDRLVNSYLLDKDLFDSCGQTVSLKRNRQDDQDEDPLVRPNQGKEMKKRRTGKEAESSKKSLTPKESTKGKPSSKSSKTGKSASADQSIKEPEHEVQMDFKEPTFYNVTNDAGQPTHTIADETQPEADPKIPKKDWLNDSPKLEVLDPEMNTINAIDDTPKQP